VKEGHEHALISAASLGSVRTGSCPATFRMLQLQSSGSKGVGVATAVMTYKV
jgi:hypothetical protein